MRWGHELCKVRVNLRYQIEELERQQRELMREVQTIDQVGDLIPCSIEVSRSKYSSYIHYKTISRKGAQSSLSSSSFSCSVFFSFFFCGGRVPPIGQVQG